MRKRKLLLILFVMAFVIGAVCSSHAALDGNTVMTQYHCTGCHGTSTIKGTDNASTVTKIMDSIAPGGMMYGMTSYGMNNLTQAEAQAIADVLFPPAPTACTSFTYGNWGACDATGHQTRTATGVPAGCTGTADPAQLTQTCTPSPVACTSFTYGNWGACDATGHQTRTATGVPAGCTGTADPAQLTQVCNYNPPVTPPPTGQTMPIPTSEEVFSYAPVDLPIVSSDPAQAEPIGVGPVATGGNTIDVRVKVGPFAEPVNVSLVVYAPALDFDDLYFMRGNELKLLSEAVDEEEQSARSGQSDHSDQSDGDHSSSHKKFGKLVVWKNNVTGVDENIYTGPVTDLPSGLYTLVLVVKSPQGDDNYYRWVTHIAIP